MPYENIFLADSPTTNNKIQEDNLNFQPELSPQYEEDKEKTPPSSPFLNAANDQTAEWNSRSPSLKIIQSDDSNGVDDKSSSPCIEDIKMKEEHQQPLVGYLTPFKETNFKEGVLLPKSGVSLQPIPVLNRFNVFTQRDAKKTSLGTWKRSYSDSCSTSSTNHVIRMLDDINTSSGNLISSTGAGLQRQQSCHNLTHFYRRTSAAFSVTSSSIPPLQNPQNRNMLAPQKRHKVSVRLNDDISLWTLEHIEQFGNGCIIPSQWCYYVYEELRYSGVLNVEENNNFRNIWQENNREISTRFTLTIRNSISESFFRKSSSSITFGVSFENNYPKEHLLNYHTFDHKSIKILQLPLQLAHSSIWFTCLRERRDNDKRRHCELQTLQIDLDKIQIDYQYIWFPIFLAKTKSVRILSVKLDSYKQKISPQDFELVSFKNSNDERQSHNISSEISTGTNHKPFPLSKITLKKLHHNKDEVSIQNKILVSWKSIRKMLK